MGPVVVLFGALSSGLLAGATIEVEARRYDGHALLEVNVPDAAALAELLAIGVDPWSERLRPGPVSVLVAPDRRAAIDASAWAVRVLSEDMQVSFDAERERLATRVPVQLGGDPFADYLTYDEVNMVLDDLAARAPDLATTIELGESIEGRAIRGIRIGTGNGEEPALIIIAGQHAREWVGISTALWIATQFVEGAADPDIGGGLDGLDIVVVPIVNPDGYEWSWAMDRGWRKNRRDGIGVDTNRNFSWNWGPPGASTEPTSETYAGSGPFSEPETAAVRDFVEAHDELVALVDLHSFSQLVMWPWCSVDEVPPDGPELEALGNDMADAISATHDVAYTPMQGIDLSLRSGNAIDWAYSTQRVFSFTIELRPVSDEPGFNLPPEQIVPVGEEALAGILVLAEWSAEQVIDETTGGAETEGTGSSDSGGDTTTTGSSTTDDGGTSTGPISTTTTTTNSDDSSSSGDVGVAGEKMGCGCRSDGRSSVATPALALAFGLRRRRRPEH